MAKPIPSRDEFEKLLEATKIEGCWSAAADAARSQLLDAYDAQQAFIGVYDELQVAYNRVLNAIPPCPVHGQCLPHYLEWIEKAKRQADCVADLVAQRDALRVACEGLAEWLHDFSDDLGISDDAMERAPKMKMARAAIGNILTRELTDPEKGTAQRTMEMLRCNVARRGRSNTTAPFQYTLDEAEAVALLAVYDQANRVTEMESLLHELVDPRPDGSEPGLHVMEWRCDYCEPDETDEGNIQHASDCPITKARVLLYNVRTGRYV